MKFIYDRKDGYLLDTEVENIFISEYMVTAPGDYVKVYIYALMCSEMGQGASPAEMARQMCISEEEVRKAFRYWNERGAVRYTNRNGEETIEFLSLRSRLFYGRKEGSGQKCEEKKETSSIYDEQLSMLFRDLMKIISRPLSGKETQDVLEWLDDYGATPVLIKKAYCYCMENYKKDSSSYVGKVVKDWALKGLFDEDSIEQYIEETNRMRFLYRRVFKALGFSRNATEEERRIMDIWFGKMNIPIDKVLEACKRTSGISNPNINYIDTVLKNMYRDEGRILTEDGEKIAPGLVLKYYDYIRESEEKAAHVRTEEIYRKIPEIAELDDRIRKSSMEISRILISNAENKREKVQKIKDRTDSMLADKAAILTENGFPADYMEPKYKCMICKDTGTTEDGMRCSCFDERMDEAKEWQISLKTKRNR